MTIKPDDAFKASSQNIYSIFGTPGEHYYLPAYQRPYSWPESSVERLLTDILSGLESLFSDPDTYSFCGSIITVTDHNYETIVPQVRGDLPSRVQLVIDGQQRLTTLLLLCLVISNRVKVNLETFISRSTTTGSDAWLKRLCDELVPELERMIVTVNPPIGNFIPIYPRITRAFRDQWSKTLANEHYESAIAEICHTYASLTDKTIPYEYQPVKAADDAKTVKSALSKLSQIVDDFSADELSADEDFSLSLSLVVANTDIFQNVGLNISQTDINELKNVPLNDDEFSALLRLIILGNYLLKRVVLAKIVCANDDYAFDVFEALNTTGTELDATETFPPLIIRDITLALYGASPQKEHLDRISTLLEKRDAGKTRQDFAKNIVISFALAESGEKISKRRSEQQKLLSKYAKQNQGNTNPLVENFRRVADLSDIKTQSQPEFNFAQISAGDLSDLQLAYKFFNDLKHDIVIAPLSRFYAETFNSQISIPTAISDFVAATKAAMAFSTLWRCKTGGADGIDSKYRGLMSGDSSFPGLARTKNNPTDVVKFKKQLRDLLNHRYADKNAFINASKRTPFYKTKTIGKILLLASHHDAAASSNGNLTIGVPGLIEFLTFKKYTDALSQEIEHIAPQSPKGTGAVWDNKIYDNDINLVHSLGNLTFVSKDINLELGNHNWAHKKVLFEALSVVTKPQAQAVFDTADQNGISFPNPEKVSAFIDSHVFVPQFESLAMFPNWDETTIIIRTENLLNLAYERLYSWLK